MPLLPLKLKHKLSKEKFSVGLDIGTSAIKSIKLKHDKGAYELTALAVETFQGDLAPALEKVIKSWGINKVKISVSGPAVIIRYVSLPRMLPEELRQALRFEAEKHIPFPIAEVSVDAHILRSDLADNKMLVLLAAVKKDFLNQRLKLLEGLGVKVDGVDIDSLALINAFSFNYPETDKTKTIALLNIGASFSNLNILEGTIPRLSRDIHIAGNKIADSLSSDLKAAEISKINPQGEQSGKAAPAFEIVLSQLAAEIRPSFDYYESQSASSVGKIFLSGGGSLFSGLKESLANVLGAEVDYWDPLKQITVAEGLDLSGISSMERATKFATAVGLAL